jgi:anti-sigma factor RsiW
MISCETAAAQMTDWLDDALSTADRLRLQLHLAICAACREVLRQLRLTVGALAALAPPAPDPERVSELGAAFRTWVAEPRDRGSG